MALDQRGAVGCAGDTCGNPGINGQARTRADASIMPRVTTGNTMAPCVVIGEHAAAFLKP